MAWRARVITNEILHMGQRTPRLRRKVLGASTTSPAVGRDGAIQLNWESSAYAENVTIIFFGGRKAWLYLLVWDSSGDQWKTPQQEKESERRARTGYIFQVDG